MVNKQQQFHSFYPHMHLPFLPNLLIACWNNISFGLIFILPEVHVNTCTHLNRTYTGWTRFNWSRSTIINTSHQAWCETSLFECSANKSKRKERQVNAWKTLEDGTGTKAQNSPIYQAARSKRSAQRKLMFRMNKSIKRFSSLYPMAWINARSHRLSIAVQWKRISVSTHTNKQIWK